MPTTPRKPAADFLPKGLDRIEKKLFRQAFQAHFGDAETISQTEIDGLLDLIRARSRVETLRKLFDAEAGEAQSSGTYPTDLITIGRQIDSTTRLAMKIADRLKATPR